MDLADSTIAAPVQPALSQVNSSAEQAPDARTGDAVDHGWIAMGEPIGSPEEAQELARQFRDLCERHGAWPVFFEVGAANLDLYLDLEPVRFSSQPELTLIRLARAEATKAR